MINRRMAIRKLVEAAIGLTAATVVWRSRLIQVGAFAVSARLGAHRVQLGGPASKFVDWSMVAKPVASSKKPPNVSSLITYHPEYHNFDPDRAIQSLAAISCLGAGWLRTDVRWREVLRDGTTVDPKAISWYRDFLRVAQQSGLRNMVVLSSPPEGFQKKTISEKLKFWNRFVEVVLRELGDLCDGYQLMNEPNNPIYGFFSLTDTADALRQAALIIRATASPTTIVAINICMDVWGWRNYLDELLNNTGTTVDVVGLDHYPWTWTVGFHERWREIFKIADAIAAATPSSPWFGRRLAIMETGFSTNTLFRGQQQQARYFASLRNVVLRLKQALPQSPVLFGIYELCDSDTSAGIDPEAHFGLMTTDLLPKLSFAEVSKLLAML
jgi:hypothetical protein